MRSPRIEFAVGAFLMLALATLLVLAVASTNQRFGFGGESYPLTARFSNVGALRLNAPVKIGGVAIGRVESIALDPVKLDSVVTLAIDGRYKELPADTTASILTNGLLGESYVGLTPGGDPQPLKPGDEIVLTQPSVDLIQLVGKYMLSGASGGSAGGQPDPATQDVTSGADAPAP